MFWIKQSMKNSINYMKYKPQFDLDSRCGSAVMRVADQY